MRTVKLKRLFEENFKGIVLFDQGFGFRTSICGPNASGKTTMLDGFLWLLSGTDSTGRTDFQVRPVDADGNMVDNVEILVRAVLEVKDEDEVEEVTLQKVQKQNWVKKRGSEAPTFQGNSNFYEINGFPASQKEFDAKVASIIDPKLFSLLTNPRKFPALKWQEQREILLQFVSEITDKDVLATDAQKFSMIADDVIAAGAEKAKEKAAATLRKLKEEQKAFPVRIDEASKSIISDIDADELGERKAECERELAAIHEERENLNTALSAVSDIQAQIMQVKLDMTELERSEGQKAMDAYYAADKAYSDAAADFRSLTDQYNRQASAIQILKASIEADEAAKADLVTSYKSCRAEKMSETDIVCPTCGRPYEPGTVEEIRSQFEAKKKSRLDKISEQGMKLKERIVANNETVQTMEQKLKKLQEEISEKSAQADALKTIAESTPRTADMEACQEYQKLRIRMEKLRSELLLMDDGESRKTALYEKEQAIRARYSEVSEWIAKLMANDRLNTRIAELQKAQMECSQKIADQEQKLFLLETFIKAKMDMLSDTINSRFSHVRFKLFQELINGGMKETCVMQIASNGSYVDYPNANNAAQIIGGLDVIEALSGLYNVCAPIWIDNAEAINDYNIPDMDTQMIFLRVTDYEALTIETVVE